jgi:glucokinase
VLATIVDDDGRNVERAERQITDHTVEVAIGIIAQAIDEVLACVAQTSNGSPSGDVGAIGIGSPGNIDISTGTVKYSPNFRWRDVPLGETLRSRFNHPVFVANDARCATLGEHTSGAGRGTRNFVLLTLGTGIGGGIVAEGTLLVGNDASAGELGHHQIRATDGFYCNCGKHGCFEAPASGTGLIRQRSLSLRRSRAAGSCGESPKSSARKPFASLPNSAIPTAPPPGTATLRT